jgi:hypothetical protein
MHATSKPLAALWVALGAYVYTHCREKGGDLGDLPLPTVPVFALLCVYMAIKVLGPLVYEQDPIQVTWNFLLTFFNQEKGRQIKVDNWIDEYTDMHDDSKASTEMRNKDYATMVNSYYELATLFYEWGWGTSFHFAYRRKGESFGESIRRHEYYLAGRLGLRSGEKVLDCGCGVGGPYRNIAQFTGCDVTGITINEYQVSRAPFVACVVPYQVPLPLN